MVNEHEIKTLYESMSDHDLLVTTATKLDLMTTRLSDFIEVKRELCIKHEARMNEYEERIEMHEGRIGTLETYFKVLVGSGVVVLGVFGVYLIDLVLRGG